jgi:hypothetical protein
MTLRRIALPLIGALALGAAPARAGLLSFNGPNGNVATTASLSEGGLTINVCGYTYARFGTPGQNLQPEDLARLARDLGLANSTGTDGVAGNHRTTANGNQNDDGEASSGVMGSGGHSFGGGSDGDWSGGWSDYLAKLRNNAGSVFDRTNGWKDHSSGPFGPYGPFDPPWRPSWPNHHDDNSDPVKGDHHSMPEPATLALLGSGLLASRLVRRRKQ